MPDDLQDFLRRAAQKRAAGQKQQRPRKQSPAQRRPPEYTSARTERQIRDIVDAEEIVEAIPVAAVESAVEVVTATEVPPTYEEMTADRDQASTAAAQDLRELFNSPHGIRQAFLMQELFNRPTDRW